MKMTTNECQQWRIDRAKFTSERETRIHVKYLGVDLLHKSAPRERPDRDVLEEAFPKLYAYLDEYEGSYDPAYDGDLEYAEDEVPW